MDGFFLNSTAFFWVNYHFDTIFRVVFPPPSKVVMKLKRPLSHYWTIPLTKSYWKIKNSVLRYLFSTLKILQNKQGGIVNCNIWPPLTSDQHTWPWSLLAIYTTQDCMTLNSKYSAKLYGPISKLTPKTLHIGLHLTFDPTKRLRSLKGTYLLLLL